MYAGTQEVGSNVPSRKGLAVHLVVGAFVWGLTLLEEKYIGSRFRGQGDLVGAVSTRD